MTPTTTIASSIIDTFLTQGQYLRGWSPKTVQTYRLSLTALTGALGGPPEPARLSPPALSAFVMWMRGRGLTPGGCNVRIRSVNSFLSWLHEDGRTDTHLRIRPLPKTLKVLMTFSDAEVRRLAAFRPKERIQVRMWTLLMVLFDTGLRIDEALGLERERIDFDGLTLTVVGKGDRERIVPISPTGRKALFRFAAKSSGRYVFATFHGERLRYRNVHRDMKAVFRLAGVQGAHVRFHNIRHYFAVSYLRNGGDLYRLSRLLGHTNITTTQVYLRSMAVEHIKEAHAKYSPLGRL
jgi:integrase/recombinase XerD